MTSGKRPDTPTVGNPNTPTLSLDAIFDLLSNEHRRHVLYYFHGESQPIATVDELVTHFCTQFDVRTAEDADRLRTQLLHGHLPKLENHGIIEYDDRSETVRYRREGVLERVVACAQFTEMVV
ncbi:DUF7344 domain-containing protein [Haladaptatus salinisoli]|uniref:DUF7344 domain-containing protein n=1 Tax=Haladaptatus salinisoli TaxID=2884876 RepID=UPI001D0B7E30|nr:hypothetical protein [Haladaptatus salinisoli]